MILLSLLSFIPVCSITTIMLSWTNNLFSEQKRKTATLTLMTTAYFAAAALVVRMDMLMVLFIVLASRFDLSISGTIPTDAMYPSFRSVFGLSV